MESKKTVVVCGGGVIGSSIAYQLSLRKLKDHPELDIIVVERVDVACAASGKAGGFLALDWCDRSPLRELARKSFEMHAQLATTLPTPYDYRRLDTLSIRASALSEESDADERPGVSWPKEWIDGPSISHCSIMGTPKTTAQVHPYKYTRALMEAATKNGARLIIGCVQRIEFDTQNNERSVSGVHVLDKSSSSDQSTLIRADAVVIAMGPWSYRAYDWFTFQEGSRLRHLFPKVSGGRAHSITLRPQPNVTITPTALFVDFVNSKGKMGSPEIYPRPDGEVYVCGESDHEPLPEDPAQVTPKKAAMEALVQFAGHMSSKLKEAKLEKTQACYLPQSKDGLPLIGKIPQVKGAYVATGHTCWGILNSPATGLAMAELILDGRASLDLSPFNPQRLIKK